MGNCSTEREMAEQVSVPSKVYYQYPTTDSANKQKQDIEQEASFFNQILPWFEHVHESKEKKAMFYDKMSNKMGELYSICMNRMEEKMSKDNMETDDLKANISRIILLEIICMVNQLQKSKNWKEERQRVYANISNCQRKIIDFLKFKYPRNKKAFVPTELEERFQNVDDSEHTDYDILINAKMFFENEEMVNHGRKYILKQIKIFMNLLIYETNKHFQLFRETMDKCFEGVEGTFKIGRKISENVSAFTDVESEHFQISSPQLFRILMKWISSMEGVFVSTQSSLNKMQYFRVAEVHDQQFSYFPLYTSKQEVISVLTSELEKSSLTYKKQLQEQQYALANFNDNIMRMIARRTNSPEINPNEIKTIKYGSYISKFIEFLAVEKLIYLLTQLIKLRESMDNKIRKAVDLIAFNVNDLLRAQYMGGKRDILKIYDRIQALENEGKLRIIRIKNRFDSPLNDVLINFIFTGDRSSFIICQLQLIIKKSNDEVTNRSKAFEVFNHVLYELGRSIFGPMAEMSLLLTHNDSRMGFEKSIKLDKHILERLRCPENQVLNQENDLNIPYACSLCCKFYHLNDNNFPIHRCLNCNYYVCPRCLFDFDEEFEEECYQKELVQYFRDQIHEVDDTEDHGFFFFNKKYKKASSLQNSKLNFFDILGAQMEEKEIRYVAIFQFKEGNRYLKFYSMESGQLRPAFYEYIPRNERKDFKKQKFGNFDLILNLDTTVKVMQKLNHEFQIHAIPLTKLDLSHKKVASHFIYKWTKYYYILDCGVAAREAADSNSSDRNNSIRIRQLDKIVVKYKPMEGKLQIDYLDLQSLPLTKKDIKNLRFAKVSNNRLRDLDSILMFESLEEIDASRNDVAHVKFSQKLPRLRVLDLSQNYIEQLDNLNGIMLPSIKELKLKLNNLQSFPKIELGSLLWLNLDNNRIKDLGNMTQSNLHLLRKLQLNKNYITSIPIVQLKDLLDFEIEENQLTDIRPIGEWKKLQHISLEKNKILDIPLLEFEDLKVLHFARNSINNLKELKNCDFTSIETLDLSCNEIKEIPELNFQNLINLDLSQNRLSEIPHFPQSDFKLLEKLNLSTNALIEITPLDMPQLLDLDISKNKIKSIDFAMHSELSMLRSFNISGNSIEAIPNLDMEELQNLNAEHNQIRNLTKFKESKVPKLMKLKLGFNMISQFFSADFPSLLELQLQSNRLSIMDEVKEEHLEKLKILNLSDNQLTQLPSMHLQSVEKIDAQNNQISDLRQFRLSKLPAINQLDFTKNQLRSFPVIEMQNLKILTLSQNVIDSIDQLAAGQFPNLEELYLDQNKLQRLSILRMRHLNILDLQKNQLEVILMLFEFDVPEINSINLSWNKVKLLCPLVSKSLAEYDVSHNQIFDLRQFTNSDLPKLYTLNLSYNLIDGILPTMHFPLLKNLFIQHNKLTTLQDFSESELPKMDILKLAHNEISVLPALNFPKLKELDISSNSLRNIEQFCRSSEMTKIVKLSLYNNHIIQLPAMEEFVSLISLTLASNEIEDMKWFCEESNLPNLQKMSLRGNKINKWFIGTYFEVLRQLNLSENKLTGFQEINVDWFPKLNDLNLKNNSIKDMHRVNLPTLNKLVLDGNPINMTNKEIKDFIKDCKVQSTLKVALEKGASSNDGEVFPTLMLKEKQSYR